MMQMIDTTNFAFDDLIDALMDLKHDLGKYIRIPFSMLPATASAGEVEAALETALHRTRSGPFGVRSAKEIWDVFAAEAGDALEGKKEYGELARSVVKALSHEAAISGSVPMPDRETLEAEAGRSILRPRFDLGIRLSRTERHSSSRL